MASVGNITPYMAVCHFRKTNFSCLLFNRIYRRMSSSAGLSVPAAVVVQLKVEFDSVSALSVYIKTMYWT